MKKTTLFGLVSLIIGITLCIIAFVMNGFDIYKFDTRGEIISNVETIESTNQDITIYTSYANIKVISSDVNHIEIVSDTIDELPQIVHSIEHNSLTIEHKQAYDLFIGVQIKPESFTIKIPNTYTGNIQIESSAGNIDYLALSAGDIQITNDFGNISTGNLSATNINIENSAGNIRLGNVICNTFIATTNAGNVDIDKIESTTITLKTNLGNIECLVDGSQAEYQNTNETGKFISSSTNLGDIEVYYTR